jgi:hypothetical protein
MGLVYRLSRKGDEKQLAAFNEKACGNPSGPEFWRWKYFENPAGQAIIALAMDGQRIVGRVGEIPLRMKVGEREVLVAQGVDTDILEEYRRGMTFFQMAHLVGKRSKADGVSFSFSFAIKLTYEISTGSLGFHHAASVRKWVKILDPTPFLRKKLKIPVIPGAIGRNIRGVMAWGSRRRARKLRNTSELSSFDERFDRLWEEAIKAEIMVVRDSTYLNWRYSRCPAADYKILAVENMGRLEGFAVLQLIERDGILYGYIADILVAKGKENCLTDLFPSAIDYFCQEGAAAVVCWVPNSSFLCNYLKGIDFWPRPIRHYIIVGSYKEEEAPLCFLIQEKNWFYTFGDSDYLLIPRIRDLYNL